jgi:4-amino-4-deoxy-L-arabinose transferase-like glycosyltransferase
MSPTSPAIVSQDGVRRLARSVLMLVCAVYVLAGFVGRDAWRNDDVVAVAHMGEIAYGHSSWLEPTLAGMPTEYPGLLPYWLGAASLKLLAPALSPDMAVRIPFMAMLVLALACTWYGTYYLARTRAAQPVPFAFGGEAQPKDYARALADGGLLALIACLGLAKLGHEATPAVAQLACAALLFLGYCIRPYRQAQGTLAASLGVLGLTLCGAPELAILLGVGGALVEWRQARATTNDDAPQRDNRGLLLVLACTAVSGFVAHALGLWQSPGYPFSLAEVEWNGYAQMLVWFMWPAWPISAWALWRWRRHLGDWSSNRHLAWPLYCVVSMCLGSLRFDNADTTLLLALPPLAALAAFSLVTMNRQVSALMDWFAVLFFSVSGIIIWVVWVAMHTGVPAAPAANVARLLPAYVPRIVWWELVLALAASAAWAALVRWRSGRHRTAIWKTLVLPAGGATLCWLLLATLWMPLLDFAQSYKSLAVQVRASIPKGQCAQTMGLDRHEIAALRWYGQVKLASPWQLERCPWLLVQAVGEDNKTETPVDMTQWRLSSVVSHFVVYRDSVLIYQLR